MTICIAAICEYKGGQLIVGASDRMLTAGDIEFEPNNTKIYQFSTLNPRVVILIADDTTVQSELCRAVNERMLKESMTSIKDVADAYCDEFVKLRRQFAERIFLNPLGLDMDTWLKKQRDMPADLARDLVDNLQGELLPAEAIVAGVDVTGAHIFVVNNPGIVQRNDDVGFAAIGFGENHAESQFMLAGYTNRWPFPDALYLTYAAKKRSEVAPSVGTYTDLFYIGASYALIGDPVLGELDKIYRQTSVKERTAQAGAFSQVNEYVERIIEQEAKAAEGKKTDASDQGGASEGAEAGQRRDEGA